MKKKLLIVTSLILIGISGWIFYNKTENTKGVQPGFKAGSNTISYGLLDDDGKVMNNGSTLEPKNNKLEYTFSLSNFIEVEREYAVIVLRNFEQTPFTVEGKPYSVYTFNAKPNKSNEFNLSVATNDRTREIDYLIFKKPNYLIDNLDISKMGALQEVLPMRFKVKSNGEKPKAAAGFIPDDTIKKGPNDTIFVSKQKEELSILPTARSGEHVFISVGNVGEKEENYHIIALNHWQQIPLENNQLVGNVAVKPGERKVFEYKLPQVQHDSNFQVIALPKPYEVSESDYESTVVSGSFRTVIKP
ncbi:hypothetical protein [Bacillus sp. mrc49]|uniref:hypothetical protein n=1 Tax=Bacillus sp. mrc49 TaxID=2054913 RepID=UPI000C26F4D5|nr:hypothetical protein [Bacillus sp. mrc49]PJN86552.1 hypothetical protein CVN76_30145 [Bacillus sp. mrc49]